MNAATTLPERSWPGLKLAVVTGVLFGAQLLLVIWMGRAHQSEEKQDQHPSRVESSERIAEIFPTAASPTLLAVPSVEGASGAAWLIKAPPTNRIPEWMSQPDAALTQPPLALADDLTNLAGPAGSALKSVAGIPKPQPQVLSVFAPASKESTFSIEGDLARRNLLERPGITSPAADSVLADTVVQIEVTADGWPAVPAAIAPGGKSGSGAAADAADDYALGVANGLRFEPLPRRSPSGARLPGRGLTSGRVVFHWRTTAPAAAEAAGPPP